MSYLIELNEEDSTLIKQIEYEEDSLELHIQFKPKYFIESITYINVPLSYFLHFSESKSIGNYYLKMIKPFFKYKNYKKMSDEKKKLPKKINKAKGSQRFLKLDIDVMKLNKAWFYTTEKGAVRAKLTLILKPDGEVDTYGNLGMIVQDVPSEIAKADKTVKGPILGNGCELDWNNDETLAGEEGVAAIADDLPF